MKRIQKEEVKHSTIGAIYIVNNSLKIRYPQRSTDYKTQNIDSSMKGRDTKNIEHGNQVLVFTQSRTLQRFPTTDATSHHGVNIQVLIKDVCQNKLKRDKYYEGEFPPI